MGKAMESRLKDIFSLNGKVAVITGGAGHLGSAMTKGLLEFGATVVAGIHENPMPFEHPHLYPVPCDVFSTASIKAFLQKTRARCGKIDVLINCAVVEAGFGPTASVEHMPDETWARGMDGAIGSTFRCTREVIPYLEENGSGCIINIASMYGVVSPDPRMYGTSGRNNPPNYSAGKAAVIQFTRYCAAHLASKNIRVNCITPGPFPKPIHQTDVEFMGRLNAKTMLGRPGKPEELVGAVILLASDASSYMTGSNIVVDGGWTAW